jgi:hypothetical protein
MPTPRTRKGGTSVEGDDGPREQTAVDSILDDAPEGGPPPAAQDVHPQWNMNRHSPRLPITMHPINRRPRPAKRAGQAR